MFPITQWLNGPIASFARRFPVPWFLALCGGLALGCSLPCFWGRAACVFWVEERLLQVQPQPPRLLPQQVVHLARGVSSGSSIDLPVHVGFDRHKGSSCSSSRSSPGSISCPSSKGASAPTATSAGVGGVTAGVAVPAGNARQTPLRSRCSRSQPSRCAWWRRSNRPRKPDRSSIELPAARRSCRNLTQIERAIGRLLKVDG